MAGSSTADLRLRPTRDGDVSSVVAAEADPDNAPFLAITVKWSVLRPEWTAR